MDRVCQLLDLSEKDHLLDVGGGWGHLAYYAATRFGCRVTSINIADQQICYAQKLFRGLPVIMRKADYRDLDGTYTKAAVIAMLTHVGPKNYRSFFNTLHRCLPQGASILIETLGSVHAKTSLEPWTERYIFPGGVVPSLRQIQRGAEGHFRIESAEEWGAHYVPTLRAWHSNLMDSWPGLRYRYPERVRRQFEYFFLSVAGTFRADRLKYWNVLMRRT
jgi:cyclopropane-fatty-acyl-phospholipid synthase